MKLKELIKYVQKGNVQSVTKHESLRYFNGNCTQLEEKFLRNVQRDLVMETYE